MRVFGILFPAIYWPCGRRCDKYFGPSICLEEYFNEEGVELEMSRAKAFKGLAGTSEALLVDGLMLRVYCREE